jgi:tetratricopeptide (TPR) repeat protein
MLAAFVCLTPRAHADKADKKHGSAEAPWAQGVSKAHQQQAFALFQEGNDLFAQERYTDAYEAYAKALAKWDHPSIQLNIAICLTLMKKPLDAWEHLEAALKYGKQGLGDDDYKKALEKQATLDATLAEVQITSEQDDVKVMLDGQLLFTGKSSVKKHVLAGPHQLVATRDGYQPETRALDLPAGQPTQQTVKLDLEKVTVQRENYERRWQWWIPWATVGSGVALALIGTGVYLAARSDMNAYDNALAAHCPSGCTPAMVASLNLSSQEEHARRVSGVGIGFWVAGGLVASAAGVMAVLNRPHLEIEGHPADVAIVTTPEYVGASFSLSFK